MSDKKVGRNASCPCGSGLKYKKCCGRSGQYHISKANLDILKRLLSQEEAKEMQRKMEQGLGRPIISAEAKGTRFVAVGNVLHMSDNWRTFHDFLGYYTKIIFGKEWAEGEFKKDEADRHPLIRWIEICSKQMKEYKNKSDSRIKPMPMTGACIAYLSLSYNLYLIAHNIKLQNILIRRLKKVDQFHGALYETQIFGALIRAGFDIELENELDGTSTHCECVAVNRKSNKKYSVEAKARSVEGVLGKTKEQGAPKDGEIKIVRKLRDALKKESDHERIVFLDINVPDTVKYSEKTEWLDNALDDIRKAESAMVINGKKAPSAYVFVTNFPFHHNLLTDSYRFAAIAEGFKISDFKVGQTMTLRKAIVAREKHKDMYDFFQSLRDLNIPATFDGEIPEFALNQNIPRLFIGHSYLVPDSNGEDVVGELVDASVDVKNQIAMGIYILENGKSIICKNPLTDEEIKAYKKSPETFFGVYKKVPKQANDALDLYEFFYETYKKSSKEKLLEFMKSSPDINELKKLSQEELAREFCIRTAISAAKK